MIYANNAGTSWPKAPTVREAVSKALDSDPQQLGEVFESAQETVCRFLGIQETQRFLFTSGCTSALAVALADLPWQEGDLVLTSSLEHHALVRPVELLKRRGVQHLALPYRPGKPADLKFAEETLARGGVRLVAVTAASNVTGELLPVAELAHLAHQHDALLLVDAAQTVGVTPVDVSTLGADLLVFAGHKGPLGPQGIGGFWAAPHVLFESPRAVCDLNSGSAAPCAPMPGYCDVGSVNIAAAAGLAAGLNWLEAHGGESPARSLAVQLDAALRERPFCTVFGAPGAERTATVSLLIDGIPPDVAEARFAEEGILVRGGQHCAPMALEAIGAPEGTVRISFGPFQQEEDLERILGVVDALAG